MCRVTSRNADTEEYKPSMNLDNESESGDDDSDSLYVYESEPENAPTDNDDDDDEESSRSDHDGSECADELRRTTDRNTPRENSSPGNSNQQNGAAVLPNGGIEVRATCSLETYPVGVAPEEVVDEEPENAPPPPPPPPPPQPQPEQPNPNPTDQARGDNIPTPNPENNNNRSMAENLNREINPPVLPGYPERCNIATGETPPVGPQGNIPHNNNPNPNPNPRVQGEQPQNVPNPRVEKSAEPVVDDTGDSSDVQSSDDEEDDSKSETKSSRLRRFPYTYALIGISVVAIAAGAAKRFYFN